MNIHLMVDICQLDPNVNPIAICANRIFMMKNLISILVIADIRFYEVSRVNEYNQKYNRPVKNISSTQETYSSSNMSSYSMKQSSQNYQSTGKQINKSPSQMKRTSSDNNRHPNSQNKLASIRILQKHILYVIGVSPSIAKEETLRRYEYFGQYGRIQQITINKENAYQSENQGICYSAYITYSLPQEASIAILAVDQFVYDSRLIRASFGRTKYCKFFLKETQCQNKECPYQHSLCDQNEILTQDDMQKRQLFQQYQSLAFQLSKVCQMSEEQFRSNMNKFRDTNYSQQQLRSIMPTAESIYEKKSLFKLYAQYLKSTQSQNSTMNLATSRSDNIKPNQQNIPETQKFREKVVENQSNQSQKALNFQRNYQSAMTTTSQSFQIKNKINENQSQMGLDEEIKGDRANSKTKLTNNENQLQSLVNDSLTQKQPKRNNSLDESRNNKDQIQQTRIQNFETQIALSLKRQFEPNSDKDTLKDQSNLFNEKETSRFFQSKEGDDEDERVPIRENIILSRRSSFGQGHQKKGFMQSLIVESLKFLIDDTDVVPNKREPLIYAKQFNTNLPSEVFNAATPAQSNLGGFIDEEYHWNNTLFSQNEFNMNPQNMGQLDDKSYYSHQGFNNNPQRFSHTVADNGNSLFTNSYFNQNFQPVRSQAFNDSNFYNTNSVHNNTYGYFGQIGLTDQFTQSQYNQLGRKTTLAQEQTDSSIAGDDKSLQLTRCPSQPHYEKLCLSQVHSRNDTNTFQPNQSGLSNTQQQLRELQLQQKKSYPNQASISVNQQNTNRLHSISFDKQSYKLNQQNLEIFDKHNESSKDLMYAKIFLQDGAASQNNIISSQSLFCYNSQLGEEYEGADINKRFSKLSDRGQIPRTPVKDSKGLFRLTDDDDYYQDDSQFDQITKNSGPKNYYKEFLSLKDNSIFSGNLFSKRRNSLEQEIDKLHPQSLQFNNTISPFITDSQTDNGTNDQGRSSQQKSKSRQRKATAMTSIFEHRD